jgi:hypothetical protein
MNEETIPEDVVYLTIDFFVDQIGRQAKLHSKRIYHDFFYGSIFFTPHTNDIYRNILFLLFSNRAINIECNICVG